ncbi:retrotransposon protein, putative, ty1-copia subclass [Tanacetum coccineum]
MTTTVINNLVFRDFFEKQRLTGPNFDWYHNLRIVLSVEDKLPFLEQPIPAMPVSPAGQVLPLDVLATYTAWVKASKEIVGLMLMTMDPDIQKNLEQLGAYDMLKELKTLTRSYLNELALQGLKGSRKLKPGALCLYVGDGHHVAVEAIGSYHLCLPGGLVLVLHNCHYAPSITRGIISFSRLYDDGFINHFENNTILVSRNNVVYLSAIPRNGIFEIDLSNSNTNDSSMYAVSNKRAKINLDSTLLWHYRLGHISKKCIEKLQHD